ncbi:MAG: tyrosine-protein kinase family protein [Sphingobium sp.]
MRLRSSESALRRDQKMPLIEALLDTGDGTDPIADPHHDGEDLAALDPHLVVALSPHDPLAQSARNLRAMIAAARLEDGTRPKVVVLLGADADAETALLSANVAIASAQAGWQTLLVDSDGRDPVQHRLFGLTSYLDGGYDDDPALTIHATPIAGLALASSAHGPSATANTQLHTALRHFIDDFDLLIVDASHKSGADAAIFGADAAIVVLRRDYTAVTDTQEILHSLRSAGTEVLGTFIFK